MLQLLNNSIKFLQLNQNLIARAIQRKGINQPVHESKHLFVTENALIELMDLCEPLDDNEINLILEKTKGSKFNHLRVKLLEKKEDYV